MTQTNIYISREIIRHPIFRKPNALYLLTYIACYAIEEEGVWSTFIEGFKQCNLSSDRVYRTAKKDLEDLELVIFNASKAGTWATLLHNDYIQIK